MKPRAIEVGKAYRMRFVAAFGCRGREIERAVCAALRARPFAEADEPAAAAA